MASALRSITSVGLAMWMAMVACLAGCGQLLASPRATSDSAASEQIATDMPECHRSHSPSAPAQQKKQDSNSVSCCLPDAISQKSTPATLQICTTEAAVPSIGIQVPDAARSAAPNRRHAWSRRGRDILLETRLLRI